jgi:hypothetical protein
LCGAFELFGIVAVGERGAFGELDGEAAERERAFFYKKD